MIPQMKEIIDRYDVDGFWVDGDAWGAVIDFCQPALDRFKERTGQVEPPTAPGQPYWLDWMTLQREQFLHYVKTYMDAVHAHRPLGADRQQLALLGHEPLAGHRTGGLHLRRLQLQ